MALNSYTVLQARQLNDRVLDVLDLIAGGLKGRLQGNKIYNISSYPPKRDGLPVKEIDVIGRST